MQAQSQRQAANLKATAKQRGQAGLPPTLSLAAALPEHGKGAPVKRRDMKSDVSAAGHPARQGLHAALQQDKPPESLQLVGSHSSLWQAECCHQSRGLLLFRETYQLGRRQESHAAKCQAYLLLMP